jgi:hypothetical protein
MIARYTIHLKHAIRVVDHWPIDVFGGRMRMIAQGETVTALEFTFAGQPVTIAPTVSPIATGPATQSITINDPVHAALVDKVANGISLLGALFALELDCQRSEAEYIAETDAERDQIAIHSFSYGTRADEPLNLTYDFVTRAMMAAEQPLSNDHRLFAALHSASREATKQARYIDSFRYSFLLLDALFSHGQFKKAALEKAFEASTVLMTAIKTAVAKYREDNGRRPTGTGIFLRSSPSPQQVSKYLIERRGHYFHGNQLKPAAWQPHKQEEARDLAHLCIGICFELSGRFSEPIFAEENSRRHFSEAKASGAIMTMIVDYTFRHEGKEQDQKDRLSINMPGTKVTRLMATEAAKQFLIIFTEEHPERSLMHVLGRNAVNGESIFEIKLPPALP